MSLQVYYHSYLIHVSSNVKLNLFCPALQENVITAAVYYRHRISLRLDRTRDSQESVTQSNLGSLQGHIPDQA